MRTPYWLIFFLPLLLLSCAGPPTLSKSTVTDSLTLSLASGASPASGTGAFYDYSQPSTVISGGVTSITSYTATAITFPGGPFIFTDMSHDTLGFSVTITSPNPLTTPVTLNYQLDGISGSGTVVPPSNVYTSGRISF